MNFWEQFAVSIFLGVLHGLKLDPSKVPALKTVLLGIYDTTGELLGLPPRTVAP